MSISKTNAKILRAAVFLASQSNYTTISREQLAKQADVSEALVNYHFASVAGLWNEVIKFAVAAPETHLEIIAQALAAGDKTAQTLPYAIKNIAMQTLLGSFRLCHLTGDFND